MNPYIIFFVIIILIFILTIAYIKIEKEEEIKKMEEIEKLPELNYDITNKNENEITEIELKEIKKIYIRLLDVETKINKTNEHLQSIETCIKIITTIMIIPIIISIIAILSGYNIIQEIF